MKALQSQRCKNEECFKPSDLVSFPDISHRHVKNKCQEGPANLIKLTMTVSAEVSPMASKFTANDMLYSHLFSLHGRAASGSGKLILKLIFPNPRACLMT